MKPLTKPVDKKNEIPNIPTNSMNKKITVAVFGLGYIGLPTAVLIASRGIEVNGVDVNKNIIQTINEGKIHIKEPDLDGLVKNVVEKGFLKAHDVPVVSDVYLIAVPTPFKEGYEPDLSYIEQATSSIVPILKKDDLIILESTSPIGTTEFIQNIINSKRPELKDQYYLAYCPERVLPGKVIYELQYNDRVIGGINPISTQKSISFYRTFVKGALHATQARTAEMCKLVENASRDVSIAFANELSMICDQANINVWELIALANKHPRVNILSPGTGVGGHCIAVDPWFIISNFKNQAKLIKQAREVNQYKTEWVIEKIKNTAFTFEKEHGKKPNIACLGLAFKPDIDDLRESPALYVTQQLIKQNFQVLPVEPNISSHKELVLVPTQEAIKKADIIVYLVAHRFFKSIQHIDKIVLDFCGILS